MIMNNESRTIKIGKNIFSGLSNKIVMLVLSFISRKVFIQYIGVEYLGINSLFTNILTILSLADMGFGIAMAYSYYKPLAENDYGKLSGLLSYYRKIYFLIAITIASLGIIVIPLLKYVVNTPEPIENVTLLYIVSLLNTVSSYLFVYKSTIITADQKTYIVNKIQICINILKVLLQIIVIYFFQKYLIFVLLELLATIVNNVVLSTVANRMYPKAMEYHSYKLDDADKKGILSNLKSVFLYKFSASIMGGTDSIIMSSICGTIIVGMYSNYLTITTQIMAFMQIFFSSFTASLGNLVIEGQKEKNYEIFRMMQMMSHTFSGIVTICLLLLTEDFIVLWLGSSYCMGIPMVLAISFNTYFTICMQPIWSYREATGLYNKTKYIMVLTAISNIILSLFLGTMLGAPGIIIATVFARLLTYFWYEPKLIYTNFFEKKCREYYIDYVFDMAIIIVSYILLSNIFVIIFNNITWFVWLLKAIIVCLVLSVLYLLRYCRTNEFLGVIRKVRMIIHR